MSQVRASVCVCLRVSVPAHVACPRVCLCASLGSVMRTRAGRGLGPSESRGKRLEAQVPCGGRGGRCVRVSEPRWEGGRPVQTRTARCHLGSSGDGVMSKLPTRTDPAGPCGFSSHGSEGLVKPEPVSPSHKGPPRPGQLSRERGHGIPDSEVGTTASARSSHGTVPI